MTRQILLFQRRCVAAAVNERRIHQIFAVSVSLKGLHALVEIAGGVALYLFRADTILERLGTGDFAGIVVTDTVPVDPLAKPEKLTVLPVSGLLAETIMNVFADDSVSAIFGGENQLF